MRPVVAESRPILALAMGQPQMVARQAATRSRTLLVEEVVLEVTVAPAAAARAGRVGSVKFHQSQVHPSTTGVVAVAARTAHGLTKTPSR